MNTVTYTVPNISCKHCVHTIQNEIGDLQGVKTVNAELESKQVTVSFEAPATAEAIEKTMAEINYPVQK
ncbi:MAG: copper ion binding protein [Anaerolineaceae bacterium]|nr:copper ion binding protein [Anaerolineaceae bacterium]